MKEVFTVKEAAEYLGMKEVSLRVLISKRKISYYRSVRRRVYFTIEDLRAYALATRVETKEEIQARAELAALNK